MVPPSPLEHTLILGLAAIVGAFVVIGLPIVLGLRHAAHSRVLQHQERMKALELGRPFPDAKAPDPDSEGEWTLARAGAAIGVKVPLGALGIAFVSGVTFAHELQVALPVWISAGAVGVTGVICGTILSFRAQSAAKAASARSGDAKPAFDPDAYDVVSRRG